MGEHLLAKVTQNFSGKNSHAQKFACSYTYVQWLAKNIFAEEAKKGQNFIFTTRN